MRFHAVVLSALLLTASCHKPDPEPVVPAVTISTFSAAIDGKSFTTSDIDANETGTTLAITATANSGTGKEAQILLSIPHYSGLADYTIDTATSAHYTAPEGLYYANGGTITIATDNAIHITGSFSFNAVSHTGAADKSVAAGHFDIYR